MGYIQHVKHGPILLGHGDETAKITVGSLIDAVCQIFIIIVFISGCSTVHMYLLHK